MSRKTLKTTVTLAAVLATAVVAPAGASVGTESPISNDLRSPDARDAVVASTSQDLRSPDARDASKVVVVASTGQDLRSPDARDVSRPNTSPVPSSAPSTGTDWGDVGMVGGAIALALLAAGGLILISRRRATVAPS